MADRTKDIWNDNDGEETPRKRSGLRRFLTFTLALVLVLAVVVLAAYRDGTGFDVLRRYLNYGSVEKASGGTVYSYDASPHNRFAVLGERLVVLSNTSLRILDGDGGEVWSTPVSMTAPALATGGGLAVAYDVGGTALYVVDQNGEKAAMTAEEGEPYIAATLNAKGWLAVTAKVKGYKGMVSVYDEAQEPVSVFRSASRFVIDAYVTDDCAALAAVTLGQENSVFVSNVLLYDLTKAGDAELLADYDISNGLVAVISQQGNALVTVSDTCVTYADAKGRIEAAYDYQGAYLREYALGDGFAALLLNRYQSGSVGRLVTVGPDGQEIGSLDVNEEIQSVSACGRYLAVLYLNSLVVYNQDLQVYASLRGIQSARDVLMRQDGTALLLSAQSAELFLP